MCIAVFMWQAHPLHALLLLYNRDEYHNRPTKPAGWWEGREILAGKDEVAGGTWLACSKQGRVAFLTNLFELHTPPGAKIRGHLPIRFLESNKNPKAFTDELAREADQYKGFNLIVADLALKSMFYISNRPVLIVEVPPGIHVLANAKLNSPWPKAERLGQKFKLHVERYGEGEIPVKNMVEKVMRDAVKADKSTLPSIWEHDLEHSLSSIFVEEFEASEGKYGTRCTAVLKVKTSGEVCFQEVYLEGGKWEQKTFNYILPKL